MLSSQGRSVAKSARIFLTAWRMTVKRSLSRWRLLSTVVLGVLLASSVLAGATIYFDALRELALGSALAGPSSKELAITAQTTRGPTSQSDYDTVLALLNQSVDEHLGWMVTDSIIVGKSPTMYLAEPGAEDQLVTDARSYFAFLPRLFEQGHVTILPGGRLPEEVGTVSPDGIPELEAVVPEKAAALFGVGVGDRMVAGPTWEDSTPQVDIVISGIFRVNNPDDDIW